MSELLYHYTRARTLMSILSSRELWFSDFRTCGEDEPRFLRRIAANTADWVERHGQSRARLAADPALATAFRHFRDRFVQLHLLRGRTPIPFVFNLSGHDDCPLLWQRGTAEICIEFSRAGLQRATGLQPIKIAYLPETGVDHDLARVIDTRLAALVAEADGATPSLDPLLRAAHEAFPLTQLKNAAYRDENEFRLVRGFRFGRDDGIFFDMGVHAQPRASIRLSDRVPIGDVITGLRFGPGFDRTLALHMVATLRRAHHLDVFPEFSRQAPRLDHAA